MLRSILLLSALSAACCLAVAQSLPRRADPGASVALPAGPTPARIVRFRDGSVLEKAGLRVGDQIVAIDGESMIEGGTFGARWRALRADHEPRLTLKRGAETIEARVRLPAMREEAIEGVDVRYGSVLTDKGYRVRTYTTRPKSAAGRLPVVVFIPWLSCGAVEAPLGLSDGWARMLRTVVTDSGMQVVRIEKPGVGDSEGPDCSRTDLDHDMAAFRAGIRAALADPGVDPHRLYLFGGSVGGALAPVLAQEFAARGLIVTGGFTRTWLEHMLDIERRRLTLSGAAPAEVNAAMKAFAGFYDRVLNHARTPGQVLKDNPQWARFWYDGPEHQYGRPIRYYQQLQALDVEDAWHKVSVPTLVVWGEYDWIMGREESDRAAAIVRARDPALATYVIRPRMNHHFDTFTDPVAAFREEGGTYDEGAAKAMVAWLRAQR